MVNKREEERREDGNEGIKEGERGKATQPSCDERNPWGDRRGKLGATEGKRGTTEGGSWGRQREKKRSRKKRLRIKILLMQILLLVSHRLCRVDGRDEIAWTNQYCDADGEGCNIDEGEEKP